MEKNSHASSTPDTKDRQFTESNINVNASSSNVGIKYTNPSEILESEPMVFETSLTKHLAKIPNTQCMQSEYKNPYTWTNLRKPW